MDPPLLFVVKEKSKGRGETENRNATYLKVLEWDVSGEQFKSQILLSKLMKIYYDSLSVKQGLSNQF